MKSTTLSLPFHVEARVNEWTQRQCRLPRTFPVQQNISDALSLLFEKRNYTHHIGSSHCNSCNNKESAEVKEKDLVWTLIQAINKCPLTIDLCQLSQLKTARIYARRECPASSSFSVFVYTYIRMIHTYIHTYIHTHMHTHTHTHTHAHTHTHTHTHNTNIYMHVY
jgi:hypothetical protein